MTFLQKTGERNLDLTNQEIAEIESKLGRKLRVAHVGNIANNAYLAARSQRDNGIDAYCFSPDYVHVMGFPEWEEMSFERDSGKGAFNPNFDEINFLRPSWFQSGSWEHIRSNLQDLNLISKVNSSTVDLHGIVSKFAFNIWKIIRPFARNYVPAQRRAWIVNSILIKLRKAGISPAKEVLSQFDILHFYGPYNYMTQLIDFNVPYITTEHGTLRDYIFSSYEQARLSKKSYQASRNVLITNQDSLPFALKCGIKIEKIEFTPHPINTKDFAEHRYKRLNFNSNNKSILIPARQVMKSNIDAGKGNEKIYEAIKICKELGLDLKFQIPLWGDNVEESMKVVKSLKIENIIEWIPLLSRPLLKEYMTNSLAVIDQLNVPAYGAIGADALGIGVPLLTRSGGENDLIAYGEIAPVLDVFDVDSIVKHISNLLTGKFDFSGHALKSQDWFDKYLDNEIATNISINYKKVLFQ